MSSTVLGSNALSLSRRHQAWWLASSLPVLIILLAFVSTIWGHLPLMTVSSLCILGLVLVAAYTDATSLKIPNWLTYTSFAWGIGLNGAHELVGESLRETLGTVGLTESLTAAIACFGLSFVLFSITGGGAGDVKLITALGTWLGTIATVDLVLYSFAFAGAYALMKAIWIFGPYRLAEYIFKAVGSLVLPLWIPPASNEDANRLRQPMPLAPSFALGTIAVLVFQEKIGLLS
jgi:Flp pilus assembly protein protease CpaA